MTISFFFFFLHSRSSSSDVFAQTVWRGFLQKNLGYLTSENGFGAVFHVFETTSGNDSWTAPTSAGAGRKKKK
jgi:hypothetical protein